MPFVCLLCLGKQIKVKASGGAQPAGFEFHFINQNPGVAPPGGAILLSGNKSMQKCLLLAEGYGRSPRGYGFQGQPKREPARYRGPRGIVVDMGWQDQSVQTSCIQQVHYLISGPLCSSVPRAAAGGEWIKADQRDELSEALAEFSFRRLSSFRLREPCSAGQGFGCPLFAYFVWASK